MSCTIVCAMLLSEWVTRSFKNPDIKAIGPKSWILGYTVHLHCWVLVLYVFPSLADFYTANALVSRWFAPYYNKRKTTALINKIQANFQFKNSLSVFQGRNNHINANESQIETVTSQCFQDDSSHFRRLLRLIQAAYHAELCLAQSEMDVLRHPRQFLTIHQHHCRTNYINSSCFHRIKSPLNTGSPSSTSENKSVLARVVSGQLSTGKQICWRVLLVSFLSRSSRDHCFHRPIKISTGRVFQILRARST